MHGRQTIGTVLAVVFLLGLCSLSPAQFYNGPGWVKYGCTTFPLTQSSIPTGTGVQDPALVYNAASAWGGYSWLKSSATDSAAAASAISTGVKTYNNAINWSDLNASLPTICELAKNTYGKAVGTVSSVEWSHATPAALSEAHDVSRNNYANIANDMLGGTVMDVIMGCGNPDYNAAGASTSWKDCKFVGGQTTWDQLKSGTHPGGWTLIESRGGIQALAVGATPARVVATAQTRETLQQRRGATQDWNGNAVIDSADIKAAPVYGDPFNASVPTLREMTQAALNCLKNRDQAGSNGFFLHVESGAVDWANHDNQLGRMIEEQTALVEAAEAVVDFIDQDGDDYTWDNTLLILTADHETGLLWGPDSATEPFNPLVSQGQGQLPLARYNSGGHANSLVPVRARGAGSEDFAALVDGYDATAAAKWGVGNYVDNTDLFTVMSNAMADGHNVVLMIGDGAAFNTWTAQEMYAVPEPAAAVLLGLGGCILAGHRRH